MVYAIERVVQQERIEEKVEIAKEMLKEGDSLEKISRVTKLSISTIQDLAKELGH